MINSRYRLISPKEIKIDIVSEKINENSVVVRPLYLSICAADQRYYQGTRGLEVLRKKLPMCLIHESVGVVKYDKSGLFKKGDKVVMIPNTPNSTETELMENYDTTSKFRSSGYDGFMQELVVMRNDRIVSFDNTKPIVACLSELISVCVHAIDRVFDKKTFKKRKVAIFGDGNLAYITAVLLKYHYKIDNILLVGKHMEKMSLFTMVPEKRMYDDIELCEFNIAFELVGGSGAEKAINQAIDKVSPEGVISLLGVSENKPQINTRMILEKGITLIGNSRSSKSEFVKSIDILEGNSKVRESLEKIINKEIIVNNVSDISKAFEYDYSNSFKTIMKWNV